ncbi:MAG: hypothetical protein PWR06_2768 [Thermoanaerobacteraceae bacterium]|nr:hypothetical protein [Thermoanaerobacteraceae bacterium]
MKRAANKRVDIKRAEKLIGAIERSVGVKEGLKEGLKGANIRLHSYLDEIDLHDPFCSSEWHIDRNISSLLRQTFCARVGRA